MEGGFGARVALFRRRRGLSQRALAKAVGRSESWMSQVERDIIPVGEWTGAAASFKAKLPHGENYDGVVVLVQAGTPANPGAILGTALLPLPGPRA